MKTVKKLPAHDCELTRLKILWRDSLPEADKDYWRSLFISGEKTVPEILAEIRDRLKINLQHNTQFTRFSAWEKNERERDIEAERQEEEERRSLAENPDWSLDQAREHVLKRAYQRASVEGDFQLGLATIKQDLAAKKVSLDSRKLVLHEQKAARDQAKKVSRRKLTPAQKEAEYKRIFGIS